MNIVSICGDYLPDHCGVVHYTQRLLRTLAAHGTQSTVLTTRDTSRGEAVVGVCGDWTVRCLPLLARAIHRRRPDLVHIQFAPGSYRFRRAITFLPLLLRATGYHNPIITTFHEYGDWEWRLGTLDGLGRLALREVQRHGWGDGETFSLTSCSDALILTNHAPRSLLLHRLPDVENRLHTIPIGINVDRVPCTRAEARRFLLSRTGWPADAEVLAFFGFCHPVKGLETLLRAFAHIRRQRLNARLLIIGGWQSLALDGAEALRYVDSLPRLAADLDIQDDVDWTGHIADDEASRLLSGADLGVLPFNHGASLKSGSLLSLLAHGLPTVTTEHTPPIREIASLARVVPPRDPDHLAGAVLSLLTDAPACSRFQQAGWAFTSRFTWESITQQHLTLYTSLLPGSHRPDETSTEQRPSRRDPAHAQPHSR